MSADDGRRILTLLAALLVALASPHAVADDEQPDIEFLEYLGSWDEGDGDWMLFDPSDEPREVNESPEDEAEPERPSARVEDSTELHDER